MIPPLDSPEDRYSSNFLLHARFAGPGEPAYDRAGRELAGHRFSLPNNRVCRAPDIRCDTLVLSGLSRCSSPEPTRFDEARDTIKALAQRFGCHRIYTTPRAFGTTKTMHVPCHLNPGSDGLHLPLSETVQVGHRGPSNRRIGRSSGESGWLTSTTVRYSRVDVTQTRGRPGCAEPAEVRRLSGTRDPTPGHCTE
jgi:hypothetical protein